jgi:hypothetical protein
LPPPIAPTKLIAFEKPGADDKIVKKVEKGIGDLKLELLG